MESASREPQPRHESAAGTVQAVSAPELMRWASFLAAGIFILLVLRLGWVSDDGFITARNWRNFWADEGLVLNLGQRVQTFTSPLFMLLGLPVYRLVQDPYAALILLSLLATLGFVALVLHKHRRSPGQAALVFIVLSASPSLLSFATSGLENSLGYVLVAAFVYERLRSSGAPTRQGFLLAALLVLTRQDFALLCVPALIASSIAAPRLALRRALVVSPLLLAWFGFALFYFGFVLPNTAYAKLNISLERKTLLVQGLAYFMDVVHRDPVIVLGLAAGCGAVLHRGLSNTARLLLLGAVTYLAYVEWIGGDFMSGRFLTVPLVLVACVVASELSLPKPGAAVLAGCLGLYILPTLAAREPNRLDTQCSGSANGVVDERACYAEHTNLVENLRTDKWRTHNYLKAYRAAALAEPSNILVFDLIGMAGFADAPTKHVVEPWSLSEPLLARLRYANTDWRPGHFPRDIPAGYLESLRSGRNQIIDPCVRRLFERLQLATHAPLFATGRARAIFELNFVEATCPMPQR